MKISILIPVYNAQKFIDKTIKSILIQDFDDFEILIINDGSTDNTLEIINNLNDKRIRIITKENGGISSARNCAISNALGEYILFVDADDYIEKDTLKKLYYTAIENSVDFVVFNYRYVYADYEKDMYIKKFSITSFEKSPNILLDVMPQFWNKLIKTSFIQSLSIKCPEGLVFEDLYFYSCMATTINSICCIDDILLNYVQQDESIMAKAKSVKSGIYDFEIISKLIIEYYKNNNLMQFSELLTSLLALNAREIVDSLFSNDNISLKSKKEAINSVLTPLNEFNGSWYSNHDYRLKYSDKSLSFKAKRYIIDYLLSKNKLDFIFKYILKGNNVC